MRQQVMKRLNQSQKIKLLLPLLRRQLEGQGLQEIQGQNRARGNVLRRKCLASLEQRKEEPEKALTRPTPQRSTVAPSDKRLTPVHLKVPPAPPQPRRALGLVDLPAARVKMKGALRLSGHVIIIGQVLGNNGATIVMNQGGPAAALQDGGKDEAAVVGAIAAKPPVVTLTPAALSALQQAAAPTATVAAATQTVTATTARRVADGGTPNVRQTLSTSGGEAEVVDDPGDISTPLLLQMTPAHVHTVTAAGRGTGGTTGAAQEALAAGAAAPVQDPGGTATAVATALQAAPPAPPKAPHADEPPGVEATLTHTAETLTALASTAPSLHVHLHQEALTATLIHPARSR